MLKDSDVWSGGLYYTRLRVAVFSSKDKQLFMVILGNKIVLKKPLLLSCKWSTECVHSGLDTKGHNHKHRGNEAGLDRTIPQ